MVDVLKPTKPSRGGKRGAPVLTMLLGMPVLTVAAAFVTPANPAAPWLTGNFEPTDAVLLAWTLAGLAWTLTYVAAVKPTLQPAPNVAPVLATASIWVLAIGAGFLVTSLGAYVATGLVNRCVGDVRFEAAQVEGVLESGKRYCRFRVDIVSHTLPGGERLCPTVQQWRQLRPGQVVPITFITSVLGRQLGLAPASLPDAKWRTP